MTIANGKSLARQRSFPHPCGARSYRLRVAATPNDHRALSAYSERALKVSHWPTLPCSKPTLNQRTRCAEVPWVKASGIT